MMPEKWLRTDGEPMSAESQRLLNAALKEAVEAGETARQWAEQWGCCPEQARLFLPLAATLPDEPPESEIEL